MSISIKLINGGPKKVSAGLEKMEKLISGVTFTRYLRVRTAILRLFIFILFREIFRLLEATAT